MAAAFEVHSVLGGGLSEAVYQESLEIELRLRAIPYSPKHPLDLRYKERHLERKYIPDLVVDGTIIVELKSVAKMLPEHEAQLLNYMRIASAKTGYLINFAPLEKVEWRRFVL